MQRKRIVVVGSSFAGFTAATELSSLLGVEHEVTVISKSDQFLFMPSLIWVPFGLCSKEDITFSVRPALEEHGVRFQHDDVTRLDLEHRTVTTTKGHQRYDYLVIATGSKPNYAAIPGLGPRGYTQSIMSLPAAERARAEFDRFLPLPGPVVIGSVQGASCHVAAYEFLFSMACQLRARGLEDAAPVTFVTAEPSVAHFGMGGLRGGVQITERFLEKLGIRTITGASIQTVSPGELVLADGQRLPFAYAMLVPSSLGVGAIRACDAITNAFGFVRVNAFGQTDAYPEVFAAGVAAAACDSAPEEMARMVARNVAARIRGEAMTGVPPSSREGTASAIPSLAASAT
jgi:NADH dehydrogenase FAD-containing subunit